MNQYILQIISIYHIIIYYFILLVDNLGKKSIGKRRKRTFGSRSAAVLSNACLNERPQKKISVIIVIEVETVPEEEDLLSKCRFIH